jgi:hypothetical protein
MAGFDDVVVEVEHDGLLGDDDMLHCAGCAKWRLT